MTDKNFSTLNFISHLIWFIIAITALPIFLFLGAWLAMKIIPVVFWIIFALIIAGLIVDFIIYRYNKKREEELKKDPNYNPYKFFHDNKKE